VLYQTMEILWMVTELLSQLELYMQVSNYTCGIEVSS
jgi:hypothetical protein